METHIFKKIDGHEIAVDIYRVEGERLQPAVLFIHGGGLITGGRKAILPSHVEAFHNGGFHFVSINYRLAPETKLPEIVRDVEDAWTWLQQKAASFGIDRERIAILGHSAGAYLALIGGYKLHPRPAALVSIAGYGRLGYSASTNLTALKKADEGDARQAVGGGTISESGPNDSMQWYLGRGLFYLFCRQQGSWLREISGHDASDADWLKEYEPLRNVSADYPPTMLLHGEPDTDVLIEESELMQQALIRHGVAQEFVRNSKWGHAFLYMPNDASVGEAFRQIVGFLKQYV